MQSSIKKSRIKAIGYGNKRPLITQRELFKLQSLAEKEKAKQRNERIEVRIISVD